MSARVLPGRFDDLSPRTRARVTGVVYLLFFVTAVLGALEVLGFLAEVTLMGWLLVMGVNAQRWEDQAAALAVPRRA